MTICLELILLKFKLGTQFFLFLGETIRVSTTVLLDYDIVHLQRLADKKWRERIRMTIHWYHWYTNNNSGWDYLRVLKLQKLLCALENYCLVWSKGQSLSFYSTIFRLGLIQLPNPIPGRRLKAQVPRTLCLRVLTDSD